MVFLTLFMVVVATLAGLVGFAPPHRAVVDTLADTGVSPLPWAGSCAVQGWEDETDGTPDEPTDILAPPLREAASGSAPVEISGFDPREDVLTVLRDPGGPSPRLRLGTDRQSGIATLRADGKEVARIHGAYGQVTLDNVVIARRAA